jgi:hypothetical protein
VPKRTHRSAAMSSKTSPTPSGRSTPSAQSAVPSGPFAPRERGPRTPEPPTWDGTKDDLPEPQYLPQFKNYQFRYDAYPLQEDCFKKPLWPDGAVAGHSRKQESPSKPTVGRPGRTTFRRDKRVCEDLQFGKPKVRNSSHIRLCLSWVPGLDRRTVAVF